MNIKQRLLEYKSTIHFCKKIRIFLFALCLFIAADRYWIVELDKNKPENVALASIEPAAGGDVEELFSDITFSGFQYEEPIKNSLVETIKEKLPTLPSFKKDEVAQLDPNKKRIAIVIDDLGIDKKRSNKVIEMANFKMTLAFLPYASNLEPMLTAGKENGHEIIVHMPMQPLSDTIDPGPVVLKVGMTAEQLTKNLNEGLSAFGGYVGINNHMGSRFTSDFVGMDFLMRELKKRDLYFLDSVTSAKSLAADRAAKHGVTYLRRHVFLDHEMTDSFVDKALAKCARRAEKEGLCIAIGHPKDVTINGLNRFVEKAKQDGFEFVTLSDIIAEKQKVKSQMQMVEAK